MAFHNRVGNLLKQNFSKLVNSKLSASNPSLFEAIRSMSTSSKIFVGGLSYSTDEMSLSEAFSKYGEVVEARVIMDRDTGRSRGFAFVTYTSTEAASSAIQAFDGQELHGRRIRVNYATEKSRSGGFGGGFGSGGGFNYGGSGGNYGSGSYQGGSFGGSGSGNYSGGDGSYTGSGGFGSGNEYPSGDGNNTGSGGFGSGNQYPSGDGNYPGSGGFGSGNQYPSGGGGYGGVNNYPSGGSRFGGPDNFTGGGSNNYGGGSVQGDANYGGSGSNYPGGLSGYSSLNRESSGTYSNNQEQLGDDQGKIDSKIEGFDQDADGNDSDEKDEANDYANTRR